MVGRGDGGGGVSRVVSACFGRAWCSLIATLEIACVAHLVLTMIT